MRRARPAFGGALAASLLVATGCAATPSATSESESRDRDAPGRIRATVVRIVDGDTLILRRRGDGAVLGTGETRVRLLEIDTPESVAPGRPVECWSHAATRELSRLAPPGSAVRVQADRDLVDPYGRTLLYLWNSRGQFVNLRLVRSGAARAVLYEPNDRHIRLMRAAEQHARRTDAGLWGACPFFGAPLG